MPTISVDKAELFKALGKNYTTQEFDELCFEFGIELDEDTTDSKRPIVDGVEEPPQLKIELPANRYDMLCFEGIAMNLNVFLGNCPPPNYRLVAPKDGELQTVTVKEETSQIRPYFSCAVLRNIKFTKARYESFIALQDKLHSNLARQRTLVAIGTHDLDTIKGPFTYEAQKPEDIKFAPLNQTKEMTGKEMMEFYEKDKHLGRYLHIIRDSPVYPIIYDSNRTVLSMPPIINSNHSKITLDTKNVFIDITATDKTKLEIVNHMIVAMFSEYCEEPFTIEPVKIVSEHNGESREAPNLTPRTTQAEVSYINSICGLKLQPQEICDMLKKMCYHAKPSSTPDILDVDVPITRADVLHQADIMEDAAIAYGFNNLERRFVSATTSVGAALPINRLADIVRFETAMAGWSEVMPLILCSYDENYTWLNRKDDNLAVRLQNPKTQEYQIVRTSLLPGLLKTIRENKHHSVPMKIFEVSDVGLKDESCERKSRNERRFAACWYGKSSGFEVVHGLLDRIMLMLKSAFITKEESLSNPAVKGYWIEEVDDPTFFAGHSAAIYVKIGDKPQRVGTFGVMHPTVLKNFELPFPVSAMEIELEWFL
ncbi:phenylalanyl-tRNA synthetase beta chain [Aureobasidium pullulans]|nr:phenylalanyl-tRNA synthetase beta chain [Aureobasidium pullulans]